MRDIAVVGYAETGLTHAEIQSFHPYDDFLIAIMLQLVGIGFCAKGAGADFALDHDMFFEGGLPLNTGGGQISAGQPGLAGGGLNLVEAVRQMFWEGARHGEILLQYCTETGRFHVN